jgi:hypothetical protein
MRPIRKVLYAFLLVLSAALAVDRLTDDEWSPERMRVLRREDGFARNNICPPIEKWPRLELRVDPALVCQRRGVCTAVERDKPFEWRDLWCFEGSIAADGQKYLTLGPGVAFGGVAFDLWILPFAGADHVFAVGHWFSDAGPDFTLVHHLRGTLTVSTLDWRANEAIRARCELRYRCREFPESTDVVEFCGEVVPTRDDRLHPPKWSGDVR